VGNDSTGQQCGLARSAAAVKHERRLFPTGNVAVDEGLKFRAAAFDYLGMWPRFMEEFLYRSEQLRTGNKPFRSNFGEGPVCPGLAPGLVLGVTSRQFKID
jgi:hypothetical protein